MGPGRWLFCLAEAESELGWTQGVGCVAESYINQRMLRYWQEHLRGMAGLTEVDGQCSAGV